MTDTRRDATSLAVARNTAVRRAARGWTLRQVSDRTATAGKRIVISTLSRIENARDGHKRVVISVDDLVVLAAAFEVSPEELLTRWEPTCTACMDSPPTGFACRTCGTEA